MWWARSVRSSPVGSEHVTAIQRATQGREIQSRPRPAVSSQPADARQPRRTHPPRRGTSRRGRRSRGRRRRARATARHERGPGASHRRRGPDGGRGECRASAGEPREPEAVDPEAPAGRTPVRGHRAQLHAPHRRAALRTVQRARAGGAQPDLPPVGRVLHLRHGEERRHLARARAALPSSGRTRSRRARHGTAGASAHPHRTGGRRACSAAAHRSGKAGAAARAG